MMCRTDQPTSSRACGVHDRLPSVKAAREALRPKATLSRRVADLEASLNLRLFERSARTLKRTQEGRALYERTATLLVEINETATAIASGSDKPRGRLRISAPLLFSQTAMGKIAAGFALKYPDVRLEIGHEVSAFRQVPKMAKIGLCCFG
jgi:DNA-binding transcriptional LysR family regulator